MDRSAKKVVGPLAAAPCPWCKSHNDFREIHSAGMLEKGSAFECDSCRKVMVVVAVRQMPQVVLGQAGQDNEDEEDDL